MLAVCEFAVGAADVVAPQINKSVGNDAFVRVCVIDSCFVETLGCLSIPLAAETAFVYIRSSLKPKCDQQTDVILFRYKLLESIGQLSVFIKSSMVLL